MCGRYSLYEIQQVLTRWNVHADEPLKSRYNLSPGQMVPIIPNDEQTKLVMAKWGLVPFWSKDPKIGFKTVNAMVETVAQKPAFKIPFKIHRCLVPADGFYEWKDTSMGKVPYRFIMKNNELFALAGIFELSKDENGNTYRSLSIITVPPNDTVKKIHSRMPGIIRREHEKLWLEDTPLNVLLEVVLKPYPADEMRGYEVSKIVNSSKLDTPEMIKPVVPEPSQKSLLDI